MKMRKVVSILLVAAMTIGMVTGCGSSSDKKTAKSDAKGKVYYLNFKPEQDEQWQELAEQYTDETGVPVTVLTAASGEYEKTLKSEMAKTDAPTLFQVNGPVGLASWKDYCYDLKDSDIAKELTDDDFTLMDGDKMAGIAYVVESYGIIYNKELLKKQVTPHQISQTLTASRKLWKTLQQIKTNLDSLHLHQQVWTVLLTGDLKLIWQTFQSTMSIKKTVLIIQMQSKVHTLTTIVRSGICTSTTQLASQLLFLQRQLMMQLQIS